MSLNLHLTKTNKYLIYALVIALVLLSNVFYWKQQVSDPFAAYRLALAKASLDNHLIPTLQSNPQAYFVSHNGFGGAATPGYTSLLVVLNSVSNIDFKVLQFLPIIGIILAVVSFVLARKMLESLVLSLVFVIYLAFQPAVHGETYNLLYPGVSLVLYFCFILIFLQMRDYRNARSWALLILALFVAQMLTYYTFAVYMIVFAVAINAFNWFATKRSGIKARSAYSIYIALLLIVIYFIFDPTFSITVKNVFENPGAFNTGIQLFFSRFTASSGSSAADALSYASGASKEAGMILVRVSTSLYALIAASVSILFAYELYSFKKTRKFYSSYAALEFALIATAIVEVLLYAIVGIISFTFVLFVLPLISLFALDRLKLNKIKCLVVLLFVGLVMSQSILWVEAYSYQFTDTNKYPMIEPTSMWLFNYTPAGRTVMTDVYTDAKLNVESAYAHETFQTLLINSRYLQFINDTQNQNTTYTGQYFVVHTIALNVSSGGSVAVEGSNWVVYPLGLNTDQLNSNINMNLVYADGQYSIYAS